MPSQGYRLSPQQKRIWLLQEGSSAYKAQSAILLQGPLDIDELSKALQSIVSRHEILRTKFQMLPGMRVPLQVVEEPGRLALERWDLRGVSLADQREKIEQIFGRTRRVRLELEQDGLLRCVLIELERERHVLMISLPSLCADRRSLNNMTREIAGVYEASLEGEEQADEVIQYAQFAQWQNGLLEDEGDQEGRNYWKKQDRLLVLPSALPLCSPAANAGDFRIESVDIELAVETVAELQSAALRFQTSVHTLLLACWYITLWRLTGEATRVIGCVFDGRPYDVLEHSVGVFARCVPVKCRCEAHYPFSEVVESVAESVCAANEWQEYFRWETRAESISEGAERLFFSAGFEFEERPKVVAAAGLRISMLSQYSCVDRFHIKLTCTKEGDSWAARFDFDPNVCHIASARRIAEYFKVTLESMASNPLSRIGELVLLGPAARHQLLKEFNDTASTFPNGQCIHTLFEGQVDRVPDRVAVVFEDLHLTFAEVNSRADHLAQSLLNRGVAPEEPVALCVNRSAETWRSSRYPGRSS